MAILKVVEFSKIMDGYANASGPIADLSSLITVQNVTFTTTTQSAALNSATRVIMLQSDTDCYFTFGLNPTATTSDIPLIADQPHYFGIGPGGTANEIAVVT